MRYSIDLRSAHRAELMRHVLGTKLVLRQGAVVLRHGERICPGEDPFEAPPRADAAVAFEHRRDGRQRDGVAEGTAAAGAAVGRERRGWSLGCHAAG